MTRVFIDANVLIAVLNKEYPLFRMAARVLSLADSPRYELYTSATCLAIAFYFSAKKNGAKAALEKMRALTAHIRVANSGPDEVKAALGNKKVHDFEDGIQYYAAVHAGCQAIITEDQHDFHFSEIPVMDCETYLREVAIPMLRP